MLKTMELLELARLTFKKFSEKAKLEKITWTNEKKLDLVFEAYFWNLPKNKVFLC